MTPRSFNCVAAMYIGKSYDESIWAQWLGLVAREAGWICEKQHQRGVPAASLYQHVTGHLGHGVQCLGEGSAAHGLGG